MTARVAPSSRGGGLPSRRVIALYARSRQTTATMLTLLGVGVAAGSALVSSSKADTHELSHFLLMLAPLAVGIVIGIATGSPFGEAERTASLSLRPIRFGVLAVLIATGGMLLALAAVAPSDDELGVIVRNCGGFVGLSLLGARFLSVSAFWVVPMTYGGAVFADFLFKPERDADWRWALQPSDDAASWIIAGVLLLAGFGVVVWQGGRDGDVEATA